MRVEIPKPVPAPIEVQVIKHLTTMPDDREIAVVAAVHQNRPVLAVIEHPADNEKWVAAPITRPERRRLAKALQQKYPDTYTL